MAGAVLWGTTGTAQALGPDGSTPLAVGAARLVFGSVLLVAWVHLIRRRVGEREGSAVGSGRRWRIALLGGLAVAGYQVAFFAAVDQAGVALGTAVTIGSAPTLTGVLEAVLHRRAPNLRWRVATVISTLGVVLLAGPGAGDVVVTGVLLAVLAGASYAVYTLSAKALIDGGMPSDLAMSRIFLAGGVVLLPVLLLSDRTGLGTGRGVVMVLWLAAATIVAAYLLFGVGLSFVSASAAATLSLAEPLTAAVLGLAVLGERLSAAAAIGCGLILLGLVVLVAGPRVGSASSEPRVSAR